MTGVTEDEIFHSVPELLMIHGVEKLSEVSTNFGSLELLEHRVHKTTAISRGRWEVFSVGQPPPVDEVHDFLG